MTSTDGPTRAPPSLSGARPTRQRRAVAEVLAIVRRLPLRPGDPRAARPARRARSAWPRSTAPSSGSPTPARSTCCAPRTARRSTAAAPTPITTTWSAAPAAPPSRWRARRSSGGPAADRRASTGTPTSATPWRSSGPAPLPLSRSAGVGDAAAACSPRGSRTRKVLPPAELALDLDPAAVALHDRLGDAQAQADALDRLLLGVPGPEEPGEQPVPVGRLDADAGVGRRRARPGRRRRASRTRTRPPAGVYLIALETQVVDDLRDPLRRRPASTSESGSVQLAARPRRPVAAGAAACDRLRARSRRGRPRCARRASAPRRSGRCAAGRPPAGAAGRCCGPRPRAGPACSAGRSVALEQDVDVPQDRGQRRAQLVGDRGHELVLDPQRPHEVGDVLVGQRGAGEAALARRGRERADTDRARRVSGSSPTQIRQSSNSSPWAGAVRRHLARGSARVDAVVGVDVARAGRRCPSWPSG